MAAEALCDAPLESCDDVNDRIGTVNGLGSGIVRTLMRKLEMRGYIDVSLDGGLSLTPRGIAAAQVVTELSTD
jgi:hypothetical protein